MGKSSSGLSWNREVVTCVYRHDQELDYGSPECVHWWETSDFIQMGIIGTNSGHVILINLVTGSMVSEQNRDGIINLRIKKDHEVGACHLFSLHCVGK